MSGFVLSRALNVKSSQPIILSYKDFCKTGLFITLKRKILWSASVCYSECIVGSFQFNVYGLQLALGHV